MAIRKLGALIDLDQLQLTPGCHQEEEIDILTHAKRGPKHSAKKTVLQKNGHKDLSYISFQINTSAGYSLKNARDKTCFCIPVVLEIFPFYSLVIYQFQSEKDSVFF